MTQQQYQQCIDACLECMNACNVCYISSLKEYDLAMLRDCIRLNREMRWETAVLLHKR